MNILLIIDMQNDFVSGVLGTPEAELINARIANHINICHEYYDLIIFTKDTHNKNYLQTREGKFLPVPHCIKNTPGWKLCPELTDACILNGRTYSVIQKKTFSYHWDRGLFVPMWKYLKDSLSIDICGVCTDICVVSNALVLRSTYPEAEIIVREDLCAGTSVEAHRQAINVMRNNHICIEP